jgi:hypothetical protein
LAPRRGPGRVGRRRNRSPAGRGRRGTTKAKGHHRRKRPALPQRRHATSLHPGRGTPQRPQGHGPGRQQTPHDSGIRRQGPGRLVRPGNPKSSPERRGIRRTNPAGSKAPRLGPKRRRTRTRRSQRLGPSKRQLRPSSSRGISLRPSRPNGQKTRRPLGSRPTSSSRSPTIPPIKQNQQNNTATQQTPTQPNRAHTPAQPRGLRPFSTLCPSSPQWVSYWQVVDNQKPTHRSPNNLDTHHKAPHQPRHSTVEPPTDRGW